MDYTDRVRDTFSGDIAKKWEIKSSYISKIKGIDNRMFEFIVAEIDKRLPADIEILEIGCGTAKLIRKLCESYKSNVNITGLEISGDMVNETRDIGDCTNVEILEENFEEYFCDKKFDIIVLKQVFHHMKNKRDNLKHMKELLKADGRIIMMFPNERYQAQILPFTRNDDILGRIDMDSMKEYVSDVDMRIADVIFTHCVATYKNLRDYFNFLYSIGSLQKIFGYAREKYNTAVSFIKLFEMLMINNTGTIQVDLDYSYYILENKNIGG